MIATALEFLPLILIDISAIPSKPKRNLDVSHRSHGNVQIPREFSATTFGAAFCNVCGDRKRSATEL